VRALFAQIKLPLSTDGTETLKNKLPSDIGGPSGGTRRKQAKAISRVFLLGQVQFLYWYPYCPLDTFHEGASQVHLRCS
jgi:hypothetical protein